MNERQSNEVALTPGSKLSLRFVWTVMSNNQFQVEKWHKTRDMR